MKMLPRTEDKGEHMATPSIRLKNLLLKIN